MQRAAFRMDIESLPARKNLINLNNSKAKIFAP
jgi:hypothetical protein